jgi:branched-chain amino acid transport system ATP-binding protein
MESPNTPLLEVSEVTKRFGGVEALASVSFSVFPGRIHCIIGPNGAGKTTLFNTISGLSPATSGRIIFAGKDISRTSADSISRLGLIRTFQQPRPITTLSVQENVALAASGVRARHRAWRLARGTDADREEVRSLLGLVRLDDPRLLPTALSHGNRKRLELAMALACRPRLLLLDEPTAGMNLNETSEMLDILRETARQVTMVLIEHDMDVVRGLADVVTVLHRGRVLCEGAVPEVEANPTVQSAYLGEAP